MSNNLNGLPFLIIVGSFCLLTLIFDNNFIKFTLISIFQLLVFQLTNNHIYMFTGIITMLCYIIILEYYI